MEFKVKGMFQRAVKKKWITFNPFDDEKYTTPESQKIMEEIQGFDPEEMEMVLETLKLNPVIYTPIILMLNTGMRTQEALGLRWGDIDFVFGSEGKESYTYAAFRRKVNRYLERKGMDKMRLHRCRHTVGTLLAAERREAIQIKRQLGITQDSTLKRYVDKKRNQKIDG